MKRFLTIAAVLAALASSAWAAPADKPVLEYVRAIRVQRGRVTYRVNVTISASVPGLSKEGVLRAIKKEAPQGHTSYEGILFRGDRMIKDNVIARYLQAELQGQRPEEKLATEISPLNYRFTRKGTEFVHSREALVYEVKPLRHRTGLFRGTVWLDKPSSLPLREQGRLVNLPSFWVKEATFTRENILLNGYAVPLRIISEVKTRVIGKALLHIEFSDYHFEEAPSLEAVSVAGDSPLDAHLPR